MLINKHGSFYIRRGWPTKIIDAVLRDKYIFAASNEEKAVDVIGVGRVMAKSMRYWASALGIVDETKDQQGIVCTMTRLGELIYEHDIFCQRSCTLWLLQRNLALNAEGATAWQWAFNTYMARSFTKDEFASAFYAYIQHEGGSYSAKAVDKEFDCFKNTYVRDSSYSISQIIEENTIPFFAPLRLIEHESGNRYTKRFVRASEIPLSVFYYCVVSDNVEYMQRNSQISIDSLLNAPNQVCRYMNLNYSTLIDLLQQLDNARLIRLYNNFGNRYIEIHDFNVKDILQHIFQDTEVRTHVIQ